MPRMRRAYSTTAGRGPSPAIWENCPWDEMVRDPELGVTFFDDFIVCPGAIAAEVTMGPYQTYIDTGGVIATGDGASLLPAASGPQCGVLNLLMDNTDNDQIFMGGNVGIIAAGQATYTKPWWFEARIAVELITDTQCGLFCGLMEAGTAIADGVIVDAGTMADKDYIGFHRLEADGDKLDTIHNLSGGADVTVKADAVTLVALTWKKVGMYFDGTDVYFYADGVVLADKCDPADTNFPDEQLMAPMLGINNAESAVNQAYIDWWRLAAAL